jgi:hypothetical protein
MGKFSLVDGIVFENVGVHDCGSFGVVLTCNGEDDFLVCTKCSKSWIKPADARNE